MEDIWFDLKLFTFNENSNHGRENHWKSGVWIPAPEGPKNFEFFFVLCSFHFQIIHTKLVTEDGTTFFKILCQFPDFPSFLICAKATALARILNLAHKVYYFQVPIKRVGPNKRFLLNTFVCLCVCFFLHVSLVPNKRVYLSIWHPRVIAKKC